MTITFVTLGFLVLLLVFCLIIRRKTRPVRRVDVLKRVRNHHDLGLCYSISDALVHFKLPPYSGICDTTKYYFPLFTRENASAFDANAELYWWPFNEWIPGKGRMAFLEWLIEQYKDDKTDLRTLKS